MSIGKELGKATKKVKSFAKDVFDSENKQQNRNKNCAESFQEKGASICDKDGNEVKEFTISRQNKLLDGYSYEYCLKEAKKAGYDLCSKARKTEEKTTEEMATETEKTKILEQKNGEAAAEAEEEAGGEAGENNNEAEGEAEAEVEAAAEGEAAGENNNEDEEEAEGEAGENNNEAEGEAEAEVEAAGENNNEDEEEAEGEAGENNNEAEGEAEAEVEVEAAGENNNEDEEEAEGEAGENNNEAEGEGEAEGEAEEAGENNNEDEEEAEAEGEAGENNNEEEAEGEAAAEAAAEGEAEAKEEAGAEAAEKAPFSAGCDAIFDSHHIKMCQNEVPVLFSEEKFKKCQEKASELCVLVSFEAKEAKGGKNFEKEHNLNNCLVECAQVGVFPCEKQEVDAVGGVPPEAKLYL